MTIYIYIKIDIFQKDFILKQIQSEIKKNRNNILVNLVELDKVKDKNTFLREVYDDYKSYYDYIVGVKIDQEILILSLLHYLEKSMLEAGLTDKMIRQAKHEYNDLLNKLEGVRNDLAEITNKVNNKRENENEGGINTNNE